MISIWHRITRGSSEKLSGALAKGYAGIRVSGNAFWFESKTLVRSSASTSMNSTDLSPARK